MRQHTSNRVMRRQVTTGSCTSPGAGRVAGTDRCLGRWQPLACIQPCTDTHLNGLQDGSGSRLQLPTCHHNKRAQLYHQGMQHCCCHRWHRYARCLLDPALPHCAFPPPALTPALARSSGSSTSGAGTCDALIMQCYTTFFTLTLTPALARLSGSSTSGASP
jgi:hypothetical protein